MWVWTICKSQESLKALDLYSSIWAVGWRKTQLLHPASCHPMAFQGFVSYHVPQRHISLAVGSYYPELMILSKEVKQWRKKRSQCIFLKSGMHCFEEDYFFKFIPNPSLTYFMWDSYKCLNLWDLAQFLMLGFPPTTFGSQRNIF